MLKRFSLKKILVSASVLVTLLIICLVPGEDAVKFKQELKYNEELSVNDIYLLDGYQYVALTEMPLFTKSIEDQALEIIDVLIEGGPGENKIPSGFKALINGETIVNNISIKDEILSIDFSKELLDTKKEYEVKVIESLVYSLTSIKGVKGIKILIDGKHLEILPQSKVILPDVLDKSFGINREYNLTSLKNVSQITIYYLNKYNDDFYYVPVTKYLNDDREKVNIIIDELANNNSYLTGLMSFMNNKAKLKDTLIETDEVILNFDSGILNDVDSKTVLKEVTQSINYSIIANYGIKNVALNVDSEPINVN
ncbi:MAG: GerMN domain-containing protein [Erysipelotrichaceae bacterium]|nr:GerMN domain-containing protein [Erysipelotrichaceae bacterium]